MPILEPVKNNHQLIQKTQKEYQIVRESNQKLTCPKILHIPQRHVTVLLNQHGQNQTKKLKEKTKVVQVRKLVHYLDISNVSNLFL